MSKRGSLAGFGHSTDRTPDDFYETPPGFTQELLHRQRFHSHIWEPAAGKGAISRVLAANDYQVLSTDINPLVPNVRKADFFDLSYRDYDIITNPPYKLIVPFTTRAFRLCHRKLAMVMFLTGLESKSRYYAIWTKLPVSHIYLSPRYHHIRQKGILKHSQVSHIWVVFDKGHEGPPSFEWFPDVIYKTG
jgi:hypothetical protein